MNTLWLAVAIGALAFIGVFGLTAALSGGFTLLQRRLATLRRRDPEQTGWLVRLRAARTVLRQIGEVVPRSPKEVGRMERKLMQAGYRRPESVYVFHGLQAVLVLAALFAFILTGRLQTNPFLYLVLSVMVGAAVPDYLLARAISRRKLAIQLGLPDALDLMVIAVEAGLGLDQTLLRVSQELRDAHLKLCDELRQYTLEVNAGKSRVEALRNLGVRSDVPDLRALTAVLIQTDRFGTSIADSLRVFSDALRTKRRQRAEEAAAKLPVKMVGPLFVFIFPATLVVVMGPAVLSIAHQLLPLLAGRR